MTTVNKMGYESPHCYRMDIVSEGILCSSFQGIKNEFDYNFEEDAVILYEE